MFGWFKKETDVKTLEKSLATLAIKVSKHEASLSQLRSNARRIKGALTLYSILIYTVYFGIWAVFLARSMQDTSRWAYETSPIVLGPVVIYFARKSISAYYSRRIRNEEMTLADLKTQQSDKIEEFKNKTNFYNTKSLIDRYSGSDTSTQHTPEPKTRNAKSSPVSSPRGPQQVLAGPPQPQFRQSPRFLPQSQMTPQKAAALAGTVPTPPSLSGTPQHLQSKDPPKTAEFAPNAEANHLATERHWYDRMLDIVIGEDEGSDKSRYKLEQNIRERDERIAHLELELMKLRSAEADTSKAQSPVSEVQDEVPMTVSEPISGQSETSATRSSAPVLKTRKSKSK